MSDFGMFDKLKYDLLINSIFERFPSVQKSDFKISYKPGLDRMKNFDSLLCHPHSEYLTIHVAGTNGKGSVSNMLASALSACGYKVGLYTSPHLSDFRERVRVAPFMDDESGQEKPSGLVPEEYVYDFLTKYSDYFEQEGMSFFEITTSLAFKWFADIRVDMAVIETGLGGRLDSTNIIIPELSIITSIGMDHCELLGNTLAQIASEKAGIFKVGVPALVGEAEPETRKVFEEKASECSSPLYYSFSDDSAVPDFFSFMDLRGIYQKYNLLTVLKAIDILKKRIGESEKRISGKMGKEKASRICRIARNIDGQNVKRGLTNTAKRMNFRGRWEKLCDFPYVLCDIGHNAHALRHNFPELENMMKKENFTSLIIVFGIMADKLSDEIFSMMPENAIYIFTSPANKRALNAEDLLKKYKEYCLVSNKKCVNCIAVQKVPDAVMKAQEIAGGQEKPLIFIGGSNFVVAESINLF